MNSVLEFIDKNLGRCVKLNRRDEGELIGLPYEYTVPNVERHNELYYWDTYFTNIGLLRRGLENLAKSNTDNILYMVNKYGYMANGNRTYFLRTSQPPFLSMMVRDIYEFFGDTAWLFGAYHVLEKEYNFWCTKRITETGLCQYDGDLSEEGISDYFANAYKNRSGVDWQEDTDKLARQAIICCESGWDMNPRWGTDAMNYVQPDLNSLIYILEENMAYFAKVLENGDYDKWKNLAQKRKELMQKYLDRGDGLLTDYNFASGKHSEVISAACLYPMFASLADENNVRAVKENLNLLEAPHGIYACAKNEVPGSYQWNYPNGWPCHQYIAAIALENYGYHDDALRIAKKYVSLAENIFESTGNLWEKYNVLEGSINVTNEYDMPPMMGWSAGVYIVLKEFTEKDKGC